MRNSSAQAWKGFIYYSFSELSHVFATLTYAHIAMYYDMFKREGIGKGQKVLVSLFRCGGEHGREAGGLPGWGLESVAYGLHVVGVPVSSQGCRGVNRGRR